MAGQPHGLRHLDLGAVTKPFPVTLDDAPTEGETTKRAQSALFY